MKAYLFTWKDITHSSGWHSQDELDDYVTDEKENHVTQLGFLVEEDENQIVFIDSWIGDGDSKQFGVIHKIPKSVIIEMICLKTNKE